MNVQKPKPLTLMLVFCILSLFLLQTVSNGQAQSGNSRDTLGRNDIAPTEEPIAPTPESSEYYNPALPPTALPEMSRSPVASSVPIKPDGSELIFNPNPNSPTKNQLESDIALRTERRFRAVEPDYIVKSGLFILSMEDALAIAIKAEPKIAETASHTTAYLGWYGLPSTMPTPVNDFQVEEQSLVWWVTFSGVVQQSSGGAVIPSNELHIVIDAIAGKALFSVEWSAVQR